MGSGVPCLLILSLISLAKPMAIAVISPTSGVNRVPILMQMKNPPRKWATLSMWELRKLNIILLLLLHQPTPY